MKILSPPNTLSARILLFLGASILSFFLGRNAVFSKAAENLNLLLITVDTLRADHVGIYGGKAKTPVIDQLGRSGVLFTNAYSHVPLTLPSHCSLLTGTLPLFHGVRDNGYRLPDVNRTLADILKAKGYRTAAFVGAFPLDSRFGLDKGFDTYDDSYGSKNLQRDLSFVERKAEEVNSKAVDWLDKNKAHKFFMWVHYFDPHAPYEPPSPFREEYLGIEYDGEIAYTDLMIGWFLEKLRQWNLMDNTLVVLTSDHGEGLGEHQEKTHGIFIYDATLHVPLIFSNPKILCGSRIVSDQVGLVDVMPTILDLLNIPPEPNIQGRSLKSAIIDRKTLRDREVYIESVAAMLDRDWAPLQGLRTKDWKYIEAPLPELYDLRKDPRETVNLIEKNPRVAQRLQTKMWETIAKNSSIASSKIQRPEMDKETQERLKSLGYITGGISVSENRRPDPKTMIEVDNLFNDAIIASESGRLEEARILYEHVIQKQPNFAIGYEYAAYNYYKMGRLQEAIGLLSKAVNSNLRTTSLLARLGLYLQEAGQLDESISILEKAVQQDPNNTEAHNYLGVSYFKSGLIAEALEAFMKALELDRDYAMAMNNLGNGYLDMKDYGAAIEEYKKAIATDPKLASAYNGLGVALYRQGLVDDALLNWKKTLELDPRQPDTYYNLGRALLRLGRKEEALIYFELFLQTATSQKYAKDIEEVRGVVERLKKELGKTS